VSVRHFGTSAELSWTDAKVSYVHFSTKEDTLAPGNTGPSHGEVDGWGPTKSRPDAARSRPDAAWVGRNSYPCSVVTVGWLLELSLKIHLKCDA